MSFINSTKELIYIGGQYIKEGTESTVCTLQNSPDLYYLIYILIFILVLIVLLKYKNFFIEQFRRVQAKKGYLKILMILPNKKIKELYKNVDNNNTFKFKNKRFCVEKMNDFIFGYDKNNLPIFLYHNNFILPFKITQTNVNDTIRKHFKDSGVELSEDESEISEVLLSLDSSILNTVYERKLLSDLYSISGMDKHKMIMVYIIIGVVFLIIAYYTGLLDKLLEAIGYSGG